MPGAIRAYDTTPTEAGQKYGHAEIVCGVQKYCSVYERPLDTPWPKVVSDGCWIPKVNWDGKMIPYEELTTASNQMASPTGPQRLSFGDSVTPEYYDTMASSGKVPPKEVLTQMLMTYANFRLQNMMSGREDEEEDSRPKPAKVTAVYSAEAYAQAQQYAGLATGGAAGQLPAYSSFANNYPTGSSGVGAGATMSVEPTKKKKPVTQISTQSTRKPKRKPASKLKRVRVPAAGAKQFKAEGNP
jgi:hypothetical protein